MLRRVQPAVVLAAILTSVCAAVVFAQQTPDDETNEKGIADRFAVVLEKNPRRGTAFDKVYGYYVERGSLVDLLNKYRSKAVNSSGSEAAAAWLIIGMVEGQRGRDSDAILAYSTAESLDQTNPIASFLLGQTLVLAGQTKEAAEAFERAIQRKPAPSDLLEIFQSLGRVYQRTQKFDKALDVWNRLEQQFPNDLRVQEQIATTLLEDNDVVAALPRFENLSRLAKDKYRQSLFRIEAAEIKVRLGRTEEALQDFEILLGQLNPDNWLFHDIRRRVESVFLKSDDQAGLVAYYEAWLRKSPDDLDAASRLARLLSSVGRSADAQTRLRQSLKKAPSNRDLRQALIVQLLNSHKYGEAVEQYQELNNRHPNNPDTLRDWGRAILKDSSRRDVERQKDAAAVWRMLVAARPKDPHAAAQVADLFRLAGMTDDAIDLYRRAIELAPDSEQYREYLGDYLFSLKRTDEALIAWREMAAESRKTAPNLARLAEVLAQHDQLSEAVTTNAQACELDPKDFNLQLKQADLLSRADKHDLALQQLAAVQKIAASDEEREAWLKRQLQTLRMLKRLTGRIADVRKDLENNSAATAEQWYWLACAEEVDGQPRAAIRAITKAASLNPDSVPILTVAARLNETQHNLRAAVEFNTKLASVNRRFRTEYLKRISTLEEKRGRPAQALQAGRDLVEGSPGNSEAVNFFAQLCFRLGKNDEGIQTLRRSLRTNPDDLATNLKLAAVLSESNQATEAVELLWRAFERARNLDERLSVVQQLAGAHGRLRQMRKLYSRLERDSHEPARHREWTLCLSRAYEAAGELVRAQSTLESLLADETRDTMLLTELRRLAERQHDLDSAIRFQRQLWKITGNQQDRFQLAQMLLQHEQSEEAIDLLTGETDSPQLSADMLRLLESLVAHGRHTEALARLRWLRKRFPDNWELLYREGALLVDSSPVAALKCFEDLLKMNHVEDDASLLGRVANPENVSTEMRLPLIERITEISLVEQSGTFRQVVQPPRAQMARQIHSPLLWVPFDYGMARLAAWYWIVNRLQDQIGDPQAYITRLFPEDGQSESRQQCIDRIVIHQLLDNKEAEFDTALRLVHRSDDDIEARVLYLKVLERRDSFSNPLQAGEIRLAKNSRRPLKDTQLDQAQAIYREVASRRDLIPLNVTLLRGLMRELTLAGKGVFAHQLLEDAAAKVTTPIEVSSLLTLDKRSLDFAITLKLLDRLLEMPHLALASPVASAQNSMASSALQTGLPEQLILYVFPRLQQSNRDEEMLLIWNRYLRLCACESVRRPNDLAAGHSSMGPADRDDLDATPELPGITLSTDMIRVLSLIHRHFQKQKRSNELVAIFENECQIVEQTATERLYRQHALAYLSWADQDRDTALAILVKAAKELPARNDLRLRLVRQFDVGKQPAKALAMLDSVSSETLEQQRELEKLAFRLAIAANQLDRVKTAADRIAASNADTQEIVVVARQLMQSGLHEAAETMLNRVSSIRPLEFPELRLLMDVQLTRCKKLEATATALAVLEQLARPAKPVPVTRVSRYKVIGQPLLKPVIERSEELRMHCYKILHGTGRLTEMIETEEKLLETAADCKQILELLVTYHSAAGNKTKVNELKTAIRNLRADAPANRYARGLTNLESGQFKDALLEMSLLIEHEPDFFASRCRDTLVRYDGKKELSEFTNLLAQIDWGRREEQLPLLASVVKQLQDFPATTETADSLFLKVWGNYPQYRIDLLQRFPDDHWWQLQQVREAMTSIVIPAAAVRAKNRFRVLGRVLQSLETDDGLVTVWNRLLSATSAAMSLDVMAAEVERGVKEWPDWTEGQVMLAMINLRRSRVESGCDSLDRLAAQLDSRLRSRPVVVWEIGQELARHPESLDVATKYFNMAIRGSSQTNWMTASSPAGAMIDAYVTHHRALDARKLLLQSVPAKLRFNPDYVLNPPAAEVLQVVSIGRRLRTLNDPIDAIEVFLAASQRLGSNPHPEMQAGLTEMFGELKPDSLVQYLEEFDATFQQLHLYVSVHQGVAEERRIYGSWDTLLNSVGKDASLLKRTQAALDRLVTVQSDQIVPLIMSAQIWFAAADQSNTAASVAKLVRFVDEHPLPKNLAATVSVNPQGIVVSPQVSIWLIARECLRRPSLAEMGNQLGQRALDASRRDETAQFTISILTEWIHIAGETGNATTVEQLTLELDKIQKPWR